MSQFSNLPEHVIKKAIKEASSYNSALKLLGLSSGEYNRRQLKTFLSDNNLEITRKPRNISPLSSITKEELKKLVLESSTYKEVLLKLGYSNNGNGAFMTLKKKIYEWNIPTDHMIHRKQNNSRVYNNAELFVNNSPVSRSVIRNRILKDELIPYECSICGQKSEWNGKPMPLILDHINGINNDHRIENLRFVCANCESQLETHGSRNKTRYYTKDNMGQ